MEVRYMIKCNLSILMGRDKKKIQYVCNETGLARNTVANLYNEKATRVDYNTMEQLCKMFHCGVGDIFEFTGDIE